VDWLLQDTQAVHVQCNGLDVEEYCSSSSGVLRGDCLYDLVSVCNHSGVLSGGHYTANCRIPSATSGDVWLDFNDTRVGSQPSKSDEQVRTSLITSHLNLFFVCLMQILARAQVINSLRYCRLRSIAIVLIQAHHH
jgi:hypothetical protein